MNLSDRQFQLAVLLLLAAVFTAVVFLGLFSEEKSVDMVAYVNLERVFAEHPARSAAEDTLNQKAAEFQQELELEAETLSGSEQQELLLEYQDKLYMLEEELLKTVTKEVKDLITAAAAEKEVKFVVEEEQILYGGYNLTDEVIAKIEAEW